MRAQALARADAAHEKHTAKSLNDAEPQVLDGAAVSDQSDKLIVHCRLDTEHVEAQE
jgi:hypothetical protein